MAPAATTPGSCEISPSTPSKNARLTLQSEPLGARRCLHQEHVGRLKSERGLLERDETSDEQRAGRDEDDRQRDFGNNECLARAAPPAARAPGRC